MTDDTYSMHGRDINATAVWFGKGNLRDHFADFCTVGRIILKWIVKKYDIETLGELAWLWEKETVAVCCEHSGK